MVIGDALSRPYATYLLLAFAKDLELPHLLRVGNGEAFAAVGIAILLDELPHQPDGFACRGAALQGDALQLLNHEHSFGVLQLFAAGDSGLTHAQLLLVDTGVRGVEEGVGVAHLRNLSLHLHARAVGRKLGVHQAVVDGGDGVTLVIARLGYVDPGAVPAVAGVTGDDRAVSTGLTTYHDAGAAQWITRMG